MATTQKQKVAKAHSHEMLGPTAVEASVLCQASGQSRVQRQRRECRGQSVKLSGTGTSEGSSHQFPAALWKKRQRKRAQETSVAAVMGSPKQRSCGVRCVWGGLKSL